MTKHTCSVLDCTTDLNGERLRKGYCPKHYQRVNKYGTPMPSKEQRSAKRAQLAPVIALCTHCGVSFTAASRSKRYCSVYCITWNKYLGPGGSKYCSDCGDPMVMSRTSKPGPGRCKECSKHGFGGYDRGCRCDICAGAKANYMRDYVEQRIERDGVHPTTALRRVAAGRDPLKPAYDRKKVPCKECGELMTSVKPQGQAVHNKCKPGSRWYAPEALRLEVYERDGWKCQICFHPVDRDAPVLSDWYPTLDHIIPQSVRVDHSPENLRLCCRYCNLARLDRPVSDDRLVRSWAVVRRSLEVV